MTSESTQDPELVSELLEVLHPLLVKIRAERTLSPGKLGILHHLSQHGQATSAELASAVRISPQGISLATRELEEREFIERVPDATDRRRSWIVLTEAGRTRLQQEARTGERWIGRAITEQLSSEQRETLRSAIPVLKILGVEAPRG